RRRHRARPPPGAPRRPRRRARSGRLRFVARRDGAAVPRAGGVAVAPPPRVDARGAGARGAGAPGRTLARVAPPPPPRGRRARGWAYRGRPPPRRRSGVRRARGPRGRGPRRLDGGDVPRRARLARAAAAGARPRAAAPPAARPVHAVARAVPEAGRAAGAPAPPPLRPPRPRPRRALGPARARRGARGTPRRRRRRGVRAGRPRRARGGAGARAPGGPPPPRRRLRPRLAALPGDDGGGGDAALPRERRRPRHPPRPRPRRRGPLLLDVPGAAGVPVRRRPRGRRHRRGDAGRRPPAGRGRHGVPPAGADDGGGGAVRPRRRHADARGDPRALRRDARAPDRLRVQDARGVRAAGRGGVGTGDRGRDAGGARRGRRGRAGGAAGGAGRPLRPRRGRAGGRDGGGRARRRSAGGAAVTRMLLRLARQSGAYALGNVAVKSSGLVLAAFYLDPAYLPKADFGYLSQLDALARVVLLVGSLGLPLGLIKFAVAAGTPVPGGGEAPDVARGTLPATVLLLSAVCGAVLCAAGWLAAPWLAAALLDEAARAPLVRLLAVYVGFKTVAEVGYAELRARERPGLFVLAVLVEWGVLIAGVVYFLAAEGEGLEGVLKGYALSAVAVG